MKIDDIEALFGKYRDGFLAPSDMLEVFENVFGKDIELPPYMQRIVTASDYMQMQKKLVDAGVDPTLVETISLDSDLNGNLTVSDLKQAIVKIATP